MQKFLDVQEGPTIAEELIWNLLGADKPDDGNELEVDLQKAIQAFRGLIYKVRSKVAQMQRENNKMLGTM